MYCEDMKHVLMQCPSFQEIQDTMYGGKFIVKFILLFINFQCFQLILVECLPFLYVLHNLTLVCVVNKLSLLFNTNNSFS